MQVVKSQAELDSLLSDIDDDSGTFAVLSSFSLITLCEAVRVDGNPAYVVTIYNDVAMHTPFDAMHSCNISPMNFSLAVLFDTLQDASSFYTHRIVQGIDEAFTYPNKTTEVCNDSDTKQVTCKQCDTTYDGELPRWAEGDEECPECDHVQYEYKQ